MQAFAVGVQDFVLSVQNWRLWTLLGWVDIRQRYARSKLGPFWLTISMGVLVTTLGVIYGGLFGQPLSTYLPMISIGMVVWALFSGIINDGCMMYVSGANYIRQMKTERHIYLLQVVWRNFIIFLHNLLIILVILLIYGTKNWSIVPLFVPGFLLLLLNASWLASFVGVFAARFRDFPQIVSSLLVVSFYVTPILFHGEMLAKKHKWVIEYNPLAYLIEVVRGPLVGHVPTALDWEVSAGMAIIGWLFVLSFLGRYRDRIPFWV